MVYQQNDIDVVVVVDVFVSVVFVDVRTLKDYNGDDDDDNATNERTFMCVAHIPTLTVFARYPASLKLWKGTVQEGENTETEIGIRKRARALCHPTGVLPHHFRVLLLAVSALEEYCGRSKSCFLQRSSLICV